MRNDIKVAFFLGLLTGLVLTIFVIQSDKGSIILSKHQVMVSYLQEVDGLSGHLRKKLLDKHKNGVISSVRVLCWVMTHPANHLTKAKFARYTWGKRCSHLIFISDGDSQPELPVVKVDAPQGRGGLWNKVQNALFHIYSNFSGQYDWVMKADDDTYVNVDSLRSFLLGHNPDDPLFFGEQLISFYGQRYVAGGGGYVLSREALHRLVTLLKDNRTDEEVGCGRRKPTSEEDPSISSCLIKAKVKTVDSRDATGLNRFSQHSGVVRESRWNDPSNWYWRYQFYKSTQIKGATGCCSSSAFSFHYTGPVQSFYLDFLMHRVNPEDTSLTLKLNPVDTIELRPNMTV